MEFTVKQSAQWNNIKTDCLIIPVAQRKNLSAILKDIDSSSNKTLSSLLKSGDIKTTTASCTLVPISGLSHAKRILFVGTGKNTDILGFRQCINAISSQLSKAPIKNACLLFSAFDIQDFNGNNISDEQLVQQASHLIESNLYRFDTTLSKKANKPALKKITFLSDNINNSIKFATKTGNATGFGANIARHLGNLPANICTPSYLATQAQDLATTHVNLSTKILSETQMKKLKMGSLLSVTEGTTEPAKFIIMDYKGGKPSEKPTVLVGKGVTFDSGGISLKPGAKMDEMKYDMCGAASVFGTMNAVAKLGLKSNVIGVVAAVENMPAGNATKPGDVITSMSGQTIEVLNTDAEGRLVLCDALTYVERFEPKAVIDIATLTGACVVALGEHASGLYSNDEKLSQQLNGAGNYTYDRAWPMPLWEEYNQQLRSNFADIGNIGGPGGGSVTAACFLSRFTKKYRWAHLDIAGSAWISGGNKGATGRPVSLLTQYIIDNG